LVGVAHGLGRIQRENRLMNKKVIIAVFIIGGSGVVNAATKGTAITPVILGSYIFLLVLSLADALGGPVAQLAGALAMLAAVVVLLTEFPWSTILSTVQGKGGTSGEAATPTTANAAPPGNSSRTQN
jgi:hypothetical protein